MNPSWTVIMGTGAVAPVQKGVIPFAMVAISPTAEVATRTMLGAVNSAEPLGVALSLAEMSTPTEGAPAGLKSTRPRTPST